MTTFRMIRIFSQSTNEEECFSVYVIFVQQFLSLVHVLAHDLRCISANVSNALARVEGNWQLWHCI